MFLRITGPDDFVYTSEQPIYIHTPKESIFSQSKTVVDSDSDLVSKSTIPLQPEDQHASDAYELKPVIDVRKRVFEPDIIPKKYGVLHLKRFATIQVSRRKCRYIFREKERAWLSFFSPVCALHRWMPLCFFPLFLELGRSRWKSTPSIGSWTSPEWISRSLMGNTSPLSRKFRCSLAFSPSLRCQPARGSPRLMSI